MVLRFGAEGAQQDRDTSGSVLSVAGTHLPAHLAQQLLVGAGAVCAECGQLEITTGREEQPAA